MKKKKWSLLVYMALYVEKDLLKNLIQLLRFVKFLNPPVVVLK